MRVREGRCECGRAGARAGGYVRVRAGMCECGRAGASAGGQVRVREGRCECGRVGASAGWGRRVHGWVDVSAGARCECRYEPRRVDECRTCRWVGGLLGLPWAIFSFLFFSSLIKSTLIV